MHSLPRARNHGSANVYECTYGSHYRNAPGQIEKCNLLVVGHPPNKILGLVEDVVREKLRANPAQSNQQARVTDSGNQDNPEGAGTVYVIAAPDGPRDVFLEADKKHKALMALLRWCRVPKNKHKGEDDYKPNTAVITNAVSAIEVIIKLLGAGWPSETLRAIFRGSKISKGDKKVLGTLLLQKDDFGEDTLMVTTWNTHFPKCGPTGNKCSIMKGNLEAAVMAFEQRTNAAEAPSVGAKRALDIATGASAPPAPPAPRKRKGPIQNFFSSATLDSNNEQKTSGGGGASSGTNPHERGAAAPAANSSSAGAGAGAGADSGASAGAAITVE